MHHKRLLSLIVTVVTMAGGVQTATGQTPQFLGTPTTTSPTPASVDALSGLVGARSYVLDPNDRSGVTIEVNVWGYVRSPGKYLVPGTTDLITLLSGAGGPADNARLSEVTIVRTVNEDSVLVERRIPVDVQRFIETGDRSQIPTLRRNDLVIVAGGVGSVFQNLVSVLRDVSLIASTIFLLVRAGNR